MGARDIGLDPGLQRLGTGPVADTVDEAVTPAGEHVPDRRRHQRVLGFEMGVEAAMGQPGLAHHLDHADAGGPCTRMARAAASRMARRVTSLRGWRAGVLAGAVLMAASEHEIL